MNCRLSVPASLSHALHRNHLVPAIFMAIVLIAAGAPVIAAETTVRQTQSKSIESPNVGVFTGRFADGMPVYQLPPISVIGHRKVELTKAQRDEQPPRNKQVGAKGVARGPA